MNYAPPAPASDTVAATFVTDEQSARRVADILAEGEFVAEFAVGLTDTGAGNWRVTVYFRSTFDAALLRDLVTSAAGPQAGAALRFERLTAKDWVAESLRRLPPVTAGRFVVYGAHDRGCAAPNRIGLEIEAALAFGSGHHGTTRCCLLALDAMCKSLRGRKSGGRILDLGTGTGILAIAAARRLRRPVLASDIDANAVRIARDNARLNRAGGLLRVCRADGLATPDIRGRAPFDLIFANILLAPLQKLAVPLSKTLAPRGRLVVSGVLKSQANAVLAAYRRLTLERRIEVDGWTTLIFRRSAAVARSMSRF